MGRADLLEADLFWPSLLATKSPLLSLLSSPAEIILTIVPSHRLRCHYRQRLHSQHHQSPSPSPSPVSHACSIGLLSLADRDHPLLSLLSLADRDHPCLVPSHRLRHHYHHHHRLHSQCHQSSSQMQAPMDNAGPGLNSSKFCRHVIHIPHPRSLGIAQENRFGGMG